FGRQLGPAGEAMRGCPHLLDRAQADILQAARVIEALDLVISIDSLPAHLAGALAVPTWVLLHADADWRWLAAGSRSPWYPTMTLFRQSRPSVWADPLRQVV